MYKKKKRKEEMRRKTKSKENTDERINSNLNVTKYMVNEYKKGAHLFSLSTTKTMRQKVNFWRNTSGF